jgi:hypothetical protein
VVLVEIPFACGSAKFCIRAKSVAMESRSLVPSLSETRYSSSRSLRRIYYGNSAHVVMELAGHRVDLLEAFDQAVAGNIVARLQYCDRYIDAFLKKRGGWGESPEWVENAPGGLAP